MIFASRLLKLFDHQLFAGQESRFGGLLLVGCCVMCLTTEAQAQTVPANGSSAIQQLESERAQLAKWDRMEVSGRLEGWEQKSGQTQPQVNLDAVWSMQVQGMRFRLELVHAPLTAQPPGGPGDPKPSPARREVVLSDGQTLHTLSNDGIEPPRGGIFYEFSQAAVLRSAGFPVSSPINYWDEAINLKEMAAASIEVSDLAEKGYVLLEDRTTYQRKVIIGGRLPFEIQRVSIRHPDAPTAFREHWLDWAQNNGHSYVKRYAVRHRYALRGAPAGQLVARQYEIHIDRFNPNPQLNAEAFELKSLALPVDTKFLDYRKNIRGKRAELRWDGQELQPID
jgi:hypothetical protein